MAFNFILTVTGFYIFISAKDSKQLNIYWLQNLIKKKYKEEEILLKFNSNEASFRTNSLFGEIFSQTSKLSSTILFNRLKIYIWHSEI